MLVLGADVLSRGRQTPSTVLDKNRAPTAPMGPEVLSSTGAGVWRPFPDSNSALDKSQSRPGIPSLRHVSSKKLVDNASLNDT